MTRRTDRLVAAVAVLVVIALAGCATTTESPAEPSRDDTFPVTITHGQGTVTVERKPERVVALGFADAQIAAALDAPVVGVARNSSSADGNWPGVSPPYPADIVTLDAMTPNVEQIAALRPDLILMTTAQPAFSQSYEELAAVAPVNLDLLDTADVAFFGIFSDPDRTEFTGQPLIAGSSLMTSGNLHYLTGDEADLLLGPNPAVTDALLEQLRPALEKLAA